MIHRDRLVLNRVGLGRNKVFSTVIRRVRLGGFQLSKTTFEVEDSLKRDHGGEHESTNDSSGHGITAHVAHQRVGHVLDEHFIRIITLSNECLNSGEAATALSRE
jgi:hypothetical protein